LVGDGDKTLKVLDKYDKKEWILKAYTLSIASLFFGIRQVSIRQSTRNTGDPGFTGDRFIRRDLCIWRRKRDDVRSESQLWLNERIIWLCPARDNEILKKKNLKITYSAA